MSWSGSIRCEHCGGLNAAGAAWCGQCLEPLAPRILTGAASGAHPSAPGQPAAEPLSPQPQAPAGPPAGVAFGRGPVGTGMPAPVHHGVFTLAQDGATWSCGRCGNVNPIGADLCASCGIPFRFTMGPPALAGAGDGFFERVGRAFRLMGASLRVLGSDPELLIFPFIGLTACLLVLAALFQGMLAWFAGPGTPLGDNVWLQWALLGAFYYAVSFIGIFTNAAVVGAAMVRLRGGDPKIGDGLRAAAGKLRPIALWSLISATVNLGLHLVESATRRGGLWERGIGRVAGVAWSALTFFVVPVILFEPAGAVEGLKRSARLFKQRWSETLVGQFGIGLAMFLLALPLVLLTVGSLMAGRWVLLGIGLMGLVAISILGATLSGIFNAALYSFATAGTAPGPFDRRDLQGTFRAPVPRGRYRP